MAEGYLKALVTGATQEAQAHYYGRAMEVSSFAERDALTEEERIFIEARDSFYMATVSENGWPYIQHRGGPAGFLRVISPTRLAFADFRGNRQLLTTGNLSVNKRVALFLMDYRRRERLKILGEVLVKDAREETEMAAQLAGPEMAAHVERVFIIEAVSFDWNCSQFITPRFSAAEVKEEVETLTSRIRELEMAARNEVPFSTKLPIELAPMTNSIASYDADWVNELVSLLLDTVGGNNADLPAGGVEIGGEQVVGHDDDGNAGIVNDDYAISDEHPACFVNDRVSAVGVSGDADG
jgi:predicted pyridoxine 5'-phosphate oxidase superfamily flavin-nucleotide-binding protein